MTKENLIPPGAEFTAPALPGDSEPDCDVDLDDFAFFQHCFTGSGGGPPGPGCGVFDFEPDTDVDISDFAVVQANLTGPVCGTVPFTVFVEGLTPSTDLGDVVIMLLTDPDGDDIFEVEATQDVTVLSIEISPSSGPLGTPLTLTMQPAISPIAFDTATTADWSGVFQPVVGPPSSPFTVTYSPSEFRESAPGTAVMILGEGDGLPPLPPEGVGPGTLLGSIAIDLSAHELTRSLGFQVSTSAIDWSAVIYAQDAAGYLDEPPTLDTLPRDEIPIYKVPSGGAVPEFVEVAFFYHTACVLHIDENAITMAEAPASFLVDLVTFDSTSVEVGRVEDVVLTLDPDDGDPNFLTYHSDLATPIVFVEGTIDPGMFENLIILDAAEDGTAIAIEPSP
ncbi:MAG: hypothetical protein ACYSVY_03575 [Planctomycetota bacterium]